MKWGDEKIKYRGVSQLHLKNIPANRDEKLQWDSQKISSDDSKRGNWKDIEDTFFTFQLHVLL